MKSFAYFILPSEGLIPRGNLKRPSARATCPPKIDSAVFNSLVHSAMRPVVLDSIARTECADGTRAMIQSYDFGAASRIPPISDRMEGAHGCSIDLLTASRIRESRNTDHRFRPNGSVRAATLVRARTHYEDAIFCTAAAWEQFKNQTAGRSS